MPAKSTTERQPTDKKKKMVIKKTIQLLNKKDMEKAYGGNHAGCTGDGCCGWYCTGCY